MKNQTQTIKHNYTQNHTITHSQMLELRNLNDDEIENLIEIYGSGFYEILMRVDLLEIEIGDDNELFITHNYELFKDDFFNELINDFESTSDSDDGGVTYETQVIVY